MVQRVNPIEVEYVCCDNCSKDYTYSEETGGMIFGSKGIGPCCTPDMMKSIEKYGEQEYIKAKCPDNLPFLEFIIHYRKATGQ